jgi:hypothetical protein
LDLAWALPGEQEKRKKRMADRPAEEEAAGVAVGGSKGKRSKSDRKKKADREQTSVRTQTADITKTADPENCTANQDTIAEQQQQQQQQQQQTAHRQATEAVVDGDNTDTQGTNEREETAEQQQSTQTTQEEREVDWEFWGHAVSDLEEVERSDQPRLAAEIKQGIPDSIRGQVWQLLARSKSPGLEATYATLLDKPSSHESVIRRDLARTFPEHEYFKSESGDGQTSLFNVIKAYSIYDVDVGYCQGIAFVAGALLLHMPEEQAFCVLVTLMDNYGMHDLYIPSMQGLKEVLFQFDSVLTLFLPDVAAHLHLEGIRSTFKYKFAANIQRNISQVHVKHQLNFMLGP